MDYAHQGLLHSRAFARRPLLLFAHLCILEGRRRKLAGNRVQHDLHQIHNGIHLVGRQSIQQLLGVFSLLTVACKKKDGVIGCAAHLDMCRTCLYAESMSKMLQVRNVPDDVHGTLKSRAAREGMSLSDFVKRELERTAQRPSVLEWLDRSQQAKPLSAKRTPVQVLRELRDAR